MTVVKAASQKVVYNAVMGRPGEQITPPSEITAKLVESADDARQFNEGIRDSAEIAANADKGFRHYLKYFRADRPVTAAVRVETGNTESMAGVFTLNRDGVGWSWRERLWVQTRRRFGRPVRSGRTLNRW
jgi:hypothetical protein